MFNFLNTNRIAYIRDLVKRKILPNLNYDELDYVIGSLCKIIEFISIKFCFIPEKYDDYWDQFIQNNNRDIIAILNLFFVSFLKIA